MTIDCRAEGLLAPRRRHGRRAAAFMAGNFLFALVESASV